MDNSATDYLGHYLRVAALSSQIFFYQAKVDLKGEISVTTRLELKAIKMGRGMRSAWLASNKFCYFQYHIMNFT